MKNYFAAILITLLSYVVPLWTQTAPADTGTLLADAERQLQWGREFLRLAPDPQAAKWLRQADTLLDKGRTALLEKQTDQATQTLTSARDLLNRACREIVDMALPLELDQVKKWAGQVEGRIPDGDVKKKNLHSRAQEHLQRSESAARNGDRQQADEYLHYANFLLEHLEQPAGIPAEYKSSNEKNRYQVLLRQSRDALSNCHNPRAIKLFRQAQRQAESGDEAFAQGNHRLGLDFYHNSTRLLLRVLNLCQRRNSVVPEPIMEELDILGRMIETALTQSQKKLNAEELQLIKRAKSLHQQAQAAVKMNDHVRAIRQIDLARALLARLWEPAPTGKRLEQEINRLQADIAAARNRLAGESASQQALLAEAERYLQITVQFQQNKRSRLAWISFLVANRFFNLLQNSSLPAWSEIKIDREMDQLQERLQGFTDDEEDRELVRLAQSLYDQARSFWQKQDALAQPFYQMSMLILDKIDLVEKI